ncbi:MAG: GTP pyrophosphokinase family protein [Spirochaetia bacterium]
MNMPIEQVVLYPQLDAELNTDSEEARNSKKLLSRFLIRYTFALQEIGTRIDILKQEFLAIHEYSPIEHVTQRVKTPESILKKVQQRGYDWSIPSIRENIKDIAGIRVSCSFISDIYRVAGMLVQQPDITVIEYKDYIEQPKANGYQSLHITVLIPVYLSDRVENVYVEIQLRTVAMDFWATLEHKIYYKYNKEVPQHLRDEIHEVAVDIDRLDKKMERIHKEMEEQKFGGSKHTFGA